MNKKNDKRKDEIIEGLHKISTMLKNKSTEPLASLSEDGNFGRLLAGRLNPQDRKELVGVICDWDEQRKAKHNVKLCVEKKKLETELKDYL